MAVKSSSQITITDITDAYSVFMDSEAFTFNADNTGAISGSCVTNITALCGTAAVAVSVTQANIKFYDQSGTQITTNIPFTAAVTSGNSGKTATITFTAANGATLTTPVEAEIPISVDSTITATKRFTLAAAKTGATGATGPQGSQGPAGQNGQDGQDGADAISISITTNNGTVFKNNSGSTKMTAHVFKGGVEQSVTENTGVCGTLGTVKWYKGLPTDTQPSGWPQSKGAITVSATDVTNAQAYTCQLES